MLFGFSEIVTQAVTGNVYMSGLGIVPAFILADVRKKSKPVCAKSPETQAAGLNGGFGCQHKASLGHMAINFLVELSDLPATEPLRWSHLRALASLISLRFQHLLSLLRKVQKVSSS